jgi:hypothetical protein
MNKLINWLLEYSSVVSAIAAGVAAKIEGYKDWHQPLIAFAITTLVIRWMKHEKAANISQTALAADVKTNQSKLSDLQVRLTKQEEEARHRYDEWSHHRTTEEAAIAAIASEVQGGTDLEERLLLRVLQSLTFKGSHIDKIFWVRYAEPLLDEFRNDRWGILEKATLIRKTGRIVDDKNRYRVMDILMGRLIELAAEQQPKQHPIYRGVAYEEELKESAAQAFIFELPELYAFRDIKIERLFVLQSEVSFRTLSAKQKEMLRRQKRAGVFLRWTTPNPEKPKNYGIYGQVALGEMEDGRNVINFDKQTVENRIQDWKRFWDKAREITDEMLN